MKKEKSKRAKSAAKFRRPYIKNRISFTTELYPNESAEKSLVTTGASGSFNIRLVPFMALTGAAAAILMLGGKIKRKRRKK